MFSFIKTCIYIFRQMDTHRLFLCALHVLLILACLAQGSEIWSWNHESYNKDINAVLRDAFDYTNHKGQFGIGADDSLSLAEDPQHSGQYVLRVFYKKGTWSGHRSDGNKCTPGEKCHRGTQFYVTPTAMTHHTYTTLTLQYEVMFDDTFSWHRGGKLPGLFGGTRDCSGGRISDTCFSTRLMWRPLGDGEVYTYVTHKQDPSWDTWCSKYATSNTESYKHIHCTTSTGIELGRGSFRFHHSKWHKIRQEVRLNSLSGQKGYIKLWVDHHAEVYVTDIIMRDNTQFDIDGIFFSTFYGGGSSRWACPHDTYTYFRNFRLSNDIMTQSHSQLVG